MSNKKLKKHGLDVCLLFIACAVLGGVLFFGCNSLASRRSENNAQIAQKIAEAPVPETVETPKPEVAQQEVKVKETELPKEQLVVEPGVTYSISIDKGDFTLKLLGNGKLLHTFPIATGKNSGDKQRVGDMRTPNGDFVIDDICEASSWPHDFGDGKGVIPNAYGPWFLSIETPGWTGIGIHGTHDPASIGTMASEGCLRMYNEDVALLKKFVKMGTKVHIQE